MFHRHFCHPLHFSYEAEVVGYKGRIGSFLYKSGNGKFVASSSSNRQTMLVSHQVEMVAVTLPTIGSLTCIHTPILVAVPMHEISNVIQATPHDRRQDLVLLANGLPSLQPSVVNMTYSVLHFGILERGQNPITNDMSPPTVLFGPHARFLSDLLQTYNVRVKIASSFVELERYALLKLLWVSFMWLLCHDVEVNQDNSHIDHFEKKKGASLNVVQVHELKQDVLRELVVEAIPTLESLLQNVIQQHDMHSSEDSMGLDVDNIMDYLESYSRSMPSAIPRKDLAIGEFHGRNGILLKFHQPLHESLVQSVLGYVP